MTHAKSREEEAARILRLLVDWFDAGLSIDDVTGEAIRLNRIVDDASAWLAVHTPTSESGDRSH